jgi:hypothetical protein
MFPLLVEGSPAAWYPKTRCIEIWSFWPSTSKILDETTVCKNPHRRPTNAQRTYFSSYILISKISERYIFISKQYFGSDSNLKNVTWCHHSSKTSTGSSIIFRCQLFLFLWFWNVQIRNANWDKNTKNMVYFYSNSFSSRHKPLNIPKTRKEMALSNLHCTPTQRHKSPPYAEISHGDKIKFHIFIVSNGNDGLEAWQTSKPKNRRPLLEVEQYTYLTVHKSFKLNIIQRQRGCTFHLSFPYYTK